MTNPERKLLEAAYFRRIGEIGLTHAASKPWSDPGCAQYMQEFGSVLALCPPPPGSLLDIGCGAGWTSAMFAQCGYHVHGIDLAPEAISFAKEFHNWPELTFAVHDFDETFSDSGRFDVAVFFDALHHSTDEVLPLRLAFDALRLGGTCVVCEPGRGHAAAEVARQAMASHGVTERDMTPEMVIRAARAVGFRGAAIYPHPQRFVVPAYRPRNSARTTRERVLRTPFVVALRAFYAASVERRSWGIVVLTK